MASGAWLLDLVNEVMEAIGRQFELSHWVALGCVAALVFGLYYIADVYLQIYRLFPLVFVLVGGQPPPI
jgi:hypothetical protein